MPDIYTQQKKSPHPGCVSSGRGWFPKLNWRGKSKYSGTFITSISIKYFPFFMSFLPTFCCNAPAFIIQPSCWKWISEQKNGKFRHGHFYRVRPNCRVGSGPECWMDCSSCSFFFFLSFQWMTVRTPKTTVSAVPVGGRNYSWQSEPLPWSGIATISIVHNSADTGTMGYQVTKNLKNDVLICFLVHNSIVNASI